LVENSTWYKLLIVERSFVMMSINFLTELFFF
jgi:hypothetical protein